MKAWLRWFFPGVLTAGLLAAAGCGTPGKPKAPGTPARRALSPPGTGAARGRPRASPQTARSLHVIGFAVNSSHRSFAAVEAMPHLLSEVAPFWYSVHRDGSVTAMRNPQTLRWARHSGIPIMPLVNNANGQYAMLLSPAARSRAVATLTQLAVRHGYDGLSVDFQGLPDKPGVRQGLNAFVTQLSQKLHRRGKRVTVNIVPTAQATGAQGAYDEATLAKHADALILMAYDRHSSGSPPGPVAPLPWVKSAIREALSKGVAPGQLYLGVANYGYDWPQGSTQAATLSYAQIKSMAAHPVWDRASGEYHFTYRHNGQTHVVWYEGERSLAQKVALARTHGLYGIAIWRLGYEDAAYWKTLGNLLGGSAPKVGRPRAVAPTPMRAGAYRRRPQPLGRAAPWSSPPGVPMAPGRPMGPPLKG